MSWDARPSPPASGISRPLALCLLLLVVTPCAARDIPGRVVSADEREVRIEIVGEGVPQLGDRVEIHFEAPGVGEVAFEGTWRVSEVGEGYVLARPAGETSGVPRPGHLATIHTSSAGSAAKRVEPDRPAPPVAPQRPAGRGQADEAARWYRRAAEIEAGAVPGMNAGDAKELYLRAARAGYPQAQFKVGLMYLDGRGVAQDYGEAMRWFRSAAESGHAGAETAIGDMYANGQGVSEDEAEAAEWYRKAAAREYSWAQFHLGQAYEGGKGVDRDYAEAARWYRLAAHQSNPFAAWRLARLCDRGRGVTRDPEEAVRWYKVAAAGGNEDAQKVLRRKGIAW